jgi:hypothetical protein
MTEKITPSTKSFIGLQIKNVPTDVYFAILDAANEEQKRFLGRKKCGLKDGLVKIIREYVEIKKTATIEMAAVKQIENMK